MTKDLRISSLILISLLFAGILFFGCTSQASPSTTTTIEPPSSTPTVAPTASATATPTPAATTTSTIASSNTTLQQTTTTSAPTATPAPTTAQPAVKEFTITARQFSFSPNTITVNKGDHVRIHLTSHDVTHGFSLPDFGVSVNLPPGSQQTVDFTADKTGTFGFFCNVFCGSGHSGMTGSLTVTG